MRSAVVVAGVFSMMAGGVFASTAHAQATWNGANGATWDTTATNWLNASGTPWDSTNGLTGTATFTATSGSAVVNGSVFANRLDYTAASGTFAIRGGTLNLAGTTPTISVNPSRTLTIGSTLAGSAGLVKSGSGTLVLTGSNTYSGTTTSAGGGTLTASNQDAFGTSVVANDGVSTVSLSSGTYANQFRVFGQGVNTTNALTTAVSSTVVINGFFTGTSAGTQLNIGPGSGSTLRFSGGVNATSQNMVVSTGTAILDSTNWIVSGLQASTNGTIVIAKSGSATFLVRFQNSNSTIRTDVPNAWGTALSYVQWNSGTSGTLDLNGNNQTAPYILVNSSLFNAGGAGRVIRSASPATLTMPQSTSGTFDGIFTGSAGLTKAGSGGNTTILTLTGPSTSTGAVTITNGTIALGTSGTGSAVQLGSLAASSIVIGSTNSTNAALDISPRGASYTFTSGQTISGTGTLVTSSTLTATSNGTWAPGNSGIGRLAVTGNLTLGGTSQFDLAAPGASTAAPGSSDLTAVSGTLALGGALNLANAGGLAGGVYRLFTYGSASGSYASVTATPATRSGPSLVTLGGSGTGAGQGVFVTVYNQAAASLVSSTSVNLGLIHAGSSFGTEALTISNAAVGGSFTEGLDAAASGTTGDASSSGAVANLAAGGTSTLVTVGLGGANTATGGVKSGAVTVGFASSGVASGLGAAAIGSQTVNVSGSVFDGNATWIQSTGGSWGSLANASWTSTGGVAAAPGTFAGYADVDTATFAGAVASGTATVALDGTQASLAGLAFSNTTARYVIATGTGSGSLTLATAAGKPTVNVIGIHEIAAAIAGSSGLQKLGVGTLVLSGSNSFSGATDITAGLLAVNGSIAGAANVAANAILGGSGSVGGLVSVAAGGILAPGNSPGTLALSSGLVLDPASILQFELNATDTTVGGGINDLVNVTGDLTLGGTLDVTGIGDFTTALNTSAWRLFNYTGGSFSGSLTLGSTPDLGGGRTFAIDTATPGEVNLVVVPEPSALLLAGVGIAAAVRLARRRLAS
jgi:fibronectin-binding autotransporter adhesin